MADDFLLPKEIKGEDEGTSGAFPGGSVVKNPPSNAGDAGSVPGRGTKIPHAAGQLSPRTPTKEEKTRTP